MELLVIIIILALAFDYINGFHDAANSIATIVSTKVLTPFQAVLWAALFNFVAFFIAKYIIGGFGIANTVSKTVIEEYITLPIILSGVVASIIWNLYSQWKGIPSSSSHTLIGGFAGAAIMANGFGAIQTSIILKIIAFIFLAPLIGMVVAFGFTLLVLHICRRMHPHTAEYWFKKLQLVSSALFSIGHGLNLQEGGHIIVWFGLTWSLELYQQANERLNRPGQKNLCRIYHLILKGTHDERVLRALTEKDKGQTAALEALRLEIVQSASPAPAPGYGKDEPT